MIHLDLFSGIGGFAYAADEVFGTVEHIFCDNDKFCQAVLRKHWPESEILDDIKKIDTDTFYPRLEGARQQTQGRRQQPGGDGQDEALRPFILTGGFPCQPFSAAGRRRGTDDDRHLWPEMLRIIRLTEPTWVIAENVRGLLTWSSGMVFEQVCTDLEDAGYEVQPVVIPAVALDAPHRRDRVWFIAHRTGDRREWPGTTTETQDGQQGSEQPRQLALRPQGQDSDVANAGGSQPGGLSGSARQAISTAGSSAKNATDSDRVGSQESWPEQQADRNRQPHETAWDTDWTEVAAELCSVDDGLPARVDGLELTKPQHRKEQLKAYGNAIVPQVAMSIMHAIKETSL